jgi:pimeloyl-ACP methyl ester carboxylesterase
VDLPEAGHYFQEDAPDAVVAAIKQVGQSVEG